MGILNATPTLTADQKALIKIERLMTRSIQRAEDTVAEINKVLDGGDRAAVITLAGPESGKLGQVYNTLRLLVEKGRGDKPEAYVGHADNPAPPEE